MYAPQLHNRVIISSQSALLVLIYISIITTAQIYICAIYILLVVVIFASTVPLQNTYQVKPLSIYTCCRFNVFYHRNMQILVVTFKMN